jgi:hypothetical protein
MNEEARLDMRTMIHPIIAMSLAVCVACGDTGQGAKKPDGEAQPPPTADADASPASVADADAAAEPEDEAELLAALDPRVLRATAIAESIERAPESSDEVLARADLDREGLDALMYEIAINPELASQYRIARGLK